MALEAAKRHDADLDPISPEDIETPTRIAQASNFSCDCHSCNLVARLIGLWQKNQTLPMPVALMSMEEASARGLVDEPLAI